jgi:myo-inositol-1-phosphate synthase
MSAEHESGPTAAKQEIAPAKGKLGVMVVGLGAVATTMIAGVEAVAADWPSRSVRSRRWAPFAWASARRTSSLVKDFVPLADLNDLVFTGWDIFEDNVYESAAHAKVLDKERWSS